MLRLHLVVLTLSSICLSSDTGTPLLTVLPNGLTVITQELHYAPVAATVICYQAGSRNEQEFAPGISHFVEHMMFKGTVLLPKSRFWQIVQRDGGMANAQEGEDVTYYYLVLPASRLEDALMIESDRMVNCVIDPAEANSEINVVLEERRMVCNDRPEGALMEAVYETAFSSHPYHMPVLGHDSDIRGFTAEMARSFYEKHYSPSNAVLAIVGNFQTDSVLVMVEDYFGEIPSGITLPDTVSPEPLQTSARFTEIEHNSGMPCFAMAFRCPPGDDPDWPALTLVKTYLTGGRTGRLEQRLLNTGLAYDVRITMDRRRDEGLFTVMVTMHADSTSDVSMEDVQEIIWEEIDSITQHGIEGDLLADLKNRYRANTILATTSPLGLAYQYAINQAVFGSHLLSKSHGEMIEEISPDQISDAAETYLRRDGVTLAVLVPAQSNTDPFMGESSLPTEIAAPDEMNYEGLEIPDDFLVPLNWSIADGVTRHIFNNGLTLLVKEDHSFPVAGISFSLPMGIFREPAAQSGLTSVTSELMLYGTEELGRTEFHNRLEREGGRVYLYDDWEAATGFLTVLSEDLVIGFETIADMFTRPAFRHEDFQRVMEEERSTITAHSDNAFVVAMNNLERITAEEDRINLVTPETLDSISLQDVVDWHRICCRPSGCVIAIVGDISTEEAIELTDHYFGNWANPNEELPELNRPCFSTAPGDTVIQYIPGREQAAVLIATEAPGFLSDDFAAFETMNAILGGAGLGTRLGHSVRDVQGLAYSVGSWVSSAERSGVFQAYFLTLADYVPRATESVIAEMGKIASENVSEIELRLAKANTVGEQAMSSLTYTNLAYRLVELETDGKSLNWNREYVNRVLQLTADDLREAASTYLNTDSLFISVAGSVSQNIFTEGIDK